MIPSGTHAVLNGMLDLLTSKHNLSLHGSYNQLLLQELITEFMHVEKMEGKELKVG